MYGYRGNNLLDFVESIWWCGQLLVKIYTILATKTIHIWALGCVTESHQKTQPIQNANFSLLVDWSICNQNSRKFAAKLFRLMIMHHHHHPQNEWTSERMVHFKSKIMRTFCLLLNAKMLNSRNLSAKWNIFYAPQWTNRPFISTKVIRWMVLTFEWTIPNNWKFKWF